MAASGIFAGAVRRASNKDHLKSSERVGECFGIGVVLLLTLFFLENQMQHTGFFTSRFGVTESLLFYGSALFGAVTMASRSLLGRRNAVRPLEVFGTLLWTLTSYVFLQVFPFDVAHFPDLLPGVMRFLFWWLTNETARLLLLIGVIAGPLQAIYTTWLFLAVRRMQKEEQH
jgi:hypothetical protein